MILHNNYPFQNQTENNIGLPQNAQEDAELTIYTYESLLADPGYDFVEGYANYSGINKENINLVTFDDANSIVTQAALEKENPSADVLIGLDNVLIHTAKTEKILEPYESPGLENISSSLISNLDPQNYIVPYDYGIIALYYDSTRINESNTPGLTELTLDSLLEKDIDKKLIVEDPTLSSPGLGFLLWTIAVYGDPQLEIDGLLKEDWRDWWLEAKSDLRIATSWGAAFTEWYDPKQNRPIMVSYGSSPAYNAVLYNDTTTGALLTHENGQNNAWLQIEGLGLVKNAPNPETAKDFIDWFLSTDLQDHIATNNWMYPANTEAKIHPKFQANAINPDEVDLLNEILTPSTLHNNLEKWKEDWENIMSEGRIAGYPLMSISMVLLGIFVIFLQNQRNIMNK
jgi:thiamine transport system substrate-binding protein